MDLVEQIVRALSTYLFSVISYRWIFKSHNTKKNFIAGLYFFAASIIIGFVWRKIFSCF